MTPSNESLTTSHQRRGRSVRSCRRPSDRGAALVEFAIVMGPLLLLIFGIIEFGFAFNDYQSVRHGVREAARDAAVARYGSDTDCGITGVTTSHTNTLELICATKNQIGLGDGVRVSVVLGPDGYQRGAPLVVCAQERLDSITGMMKPILDGKALTTRVEMRIEKTTGELVESVAEEPLPGQNWGFCGDPDSTETETPPTPEAAVAP